MSLLIWTQFFDDFTDINTIFGINTINFQSNNC